MSTNNSQISNVVRHGQTQKGRINKALLPENVHLDDRTITDFILFAKRYSSYIKYYPQGPANDRNWEAFWGKDISAVLASIAGFPIDDYFEFYKDLKKFILNLIAENNIVPLSKHFRLFFQMSIWIVKELIQIEISLNTHPELKNLLNALMVKELETPFERIIGYFKGANLEIPSVPNFKDISIKPSDFQGINDITIPDLIKTQLDDLQDFEFANLQLPYTNKIWVNYYTDINPDQNPYIEEISVKAKIYDALNYNLFIANFESVLEAMVFAVDLFKEELKKSLNNYPRHAPHYSLWLCFAQLFQYQREELNRIPKRHLEYYYQEILKQGLLAPQPTRAHILFELNKGVSKHLLQSGTLLNGGKDDLGNEVQYQLLDDLLINTAKVSEIKSVFNGEGSLPIAAPKTNSLDGIEEELNESYPQWKPFFQGNPNSTETLIKARLGFALADKDLFLKEGNRKITLTLSEDIDDSKYKTDDLIAYYTAEEGWEKVTIEHVSGDQLLFEIDSGQPSFVHFDQDVHVDEDHTDTFNTKHPILKVVLLANYSRWRSFENKSVTLSVEVSGVKNLFVQNKDGIMDTSKAFPLFGVIPDKKPSVTIGSNEIFSKKLDSLTLNLVWQEVFQFYYHYYDLQIDSYNRDDYKFRLEYLNNGNWDYEGSGTAFDHYLFESGSLTSISIKDDVNLLNFNASQSVENEIYSSISKDGFIKLEVNNDFGHDVYQIALAQKMIALANKEPNVPVYEPYHAKVNMLSINYITKIRQPQQFFELHPFGYAETDNRSRLVPVIENTGEQYIGISELVPEQKVHILFQVLSGTSDPLADPAKVEWSYLKDNQWEVDFFDVDDKTDEFARSGIIALTIPKQATKSNTILPNDYHWIRMAVKDNYLALNDFIGIHAQAAIVEFLDQDNDPSFLNTPLETETISKLAVATDVIKTVTQKYGGFNRRGTEPLDRYYTRVSERLRHKNRAIQLWDYEHLVLENFPNIYRVKCLNHTRLDEPVRPGHVTIVALPKINTLLKNPMKPYTDKDTRIDIHNFLKSRISPFICLHLVQPKLEAIQIECSVKFNDELVDLIFYNDRLKTTLIQFLTPWAFSNKKDVHFGGKWYKADIINFIDEQPYVSYVKDLKMYHKLNIDAVTFNKIDQEVIIASTARSVLVSDNMHLITPMENVLITDNNEEVNCKCKNKELI